MVDFVFLISSCMCDITAAFKRSRRKSASSVITYIVRIDNNMWYFVINEQRGGATEETIRK